MAKKPRSPSRRPGQSQDPDDAFLAKVLELTTWARKNRQTLIVAGVVAILLVVGGLYYWNLRVTEAREAAQELERLQQVVAMSEPQEGKAELRGFLERYGGTRFAHEARLSLAELHLLDGEVSDAIDVLDPSRRDLGDPVAVQGAYLLAIAYEEAGRWRDAEELYLELVDRVDLGFQRREALEGAARSRVERDDVDGALELYGQILDELEDDDPRRSRFELKMAELEARTQS